MKKDPTQKNPMKKISAIRIAAAFVLLLTAHTPLAWASGDECSAEEKKADAARMKKAEDEERAGKLKQAYKTMPRYGSISCLSGYSDERHEAMQKRIGLKLGQQDEKQGRLEEAFDWYDDSGNVADADRVKMKQVNASPRDYMLIFNAIRRCCGGDDNRKHMVELRQLAAKNAEIELANEEKAFAANKVSLDQLENAKDWFDLVGEGADKKAHERAEQRGDTLIKEDTYQHLKNARRYFGMAQAKSKEKALRDKALRLAQEHEKKGEITQAANFYSLAGAKDKSNELEARAEAQDRKSEARAEAQHKKSEEVRQKKFTQEQDDLEKELGL